MKIALSFFSKKKKKKTSHISFQEKKFQASSAGLIGMEEWES